ncbi:MAG TPA: hypothetical protein VMU69_28075 [Bradyrhizobium sp.]|nr:hypothetical protein [Bradyrhizobium sp.]
MRLIAANLKLLVLGDANAVPSRPSFVPEIRVDPAAGSDTADRDDRPAFQPHTLNTAHGRDPFDLRHDPGIRETPQAFTGIFWDREEDDGIDDIRAPKARDISGHAPGARAALSGVH